MRILGYLVVFFCFTLHLFIPMNTSLISNELGLVNIIFYSLGILYFSLLIKKIINKHEFNYDLLFLVMTLWIANFISYIYFNIFESFIISFFGILICLIDLTFLFKRIKKINKRYPKYLYCLFSFYFYLLIILFKFL